MRATHQAPQASGPRCIHCPYCRRSASESGRRAARIAAWAPAMSYSARRQSAVQRVGVEQQPGRARVAVARLAGRARVDQPLAARRRRARSPSRRVGAGRRLALRPVERQRHVRVADEARRGSRSRRSTARRSAPESTYSQTGSRGEAWKSPTPSACALRLEREQELARLGRIVAASSCAASAAPREKSSSDSTSTTARSWLPARQIVQWRVGERDARVGLGAVADEVAEAPQLLGARRPRRRRSPPRRRAGCRGCRRRSRPAWRGVTVYSVPQAAPPAGRRRRRAGRWRRRRCCSCGRASALEPVDVARASLLQRGGDRAGRALPQRPAAALRRAAWRSSSACSCAVVRRPPRGPCRRPVLAGAAVAAAALGWRSTLATLPLRAIARQRAKDVGLVTQSWGGWAGDVVKGTAIGARDRRAPAAALLVFASAASAGAGGCPAPSLVIALRVVFSRTRPGRARPAVQPLHAAARRRDCATTCSSSRDGRASTSARSTRWTRRGARPRPTPTSTGSAAPSASCSTTRC